MKSIFSSEEKNKEVIKDYVCLRFAKLMKKMKEAFLINKNNNSNSNSNLPSDYNLSDLASKIKKNFYNALEKDEILFDSNLKEKSNQILNEKDQGLQTVFF